MSMKLLLLLFHCFSCLILSWCLLHRVCFFRMWTAELDHCVVLTLLCWLLICLVFHLIICKCLVYLNYTANHYNQRREITYHFEFFQGRLTVSPDWNERLLRKGPLTAGQRFRPSWFCVSSDWRYSGCWRQPGFDCFAGECSQWRPDSIIIFEYF